MDALQQNWKDNNEYRFASREFNTHHGKMHYVDEGEGETILFVHGTPVWSFVYRKMIRHFSKNFRCVAVDHLGFGKSEKPKNFSYTPEAHAKNLEQFIEGLGLKNFRLVVHDFGGPIGLSYALNHPENVKKIVVFNTWMWSHEHDRTIKRASNLFAGWFGKFLYLRMNFSPKTLLKMAFADKNKLTKPLHAMYLSPFPNKDSRRSTWVFAKELYQSFPWFSSLWAKREKIKNIPALILWGMKDKFLRPDFLKKFENVFENRTIIKFENAGHFVQEEASEEAIVEMEKFFGQ